MADQSEVTIRYTVLAEPCYERVFFRKGRSGRPTVEIRGRTDWNGYVVAKLMTNELFTTTYPVGKRHGFRHDLYVPYDVDWLKGMNCRFYGGKAGCIEDVRLGSRPHWWPAAGWKRTGWLVAESDDSWIDRLDQEPFVPPRGSLPLVFDPDRKLPGKLAWILESARLAEDSCPERGVYIRCSPRRLGFVLFAVRIVCDLIGARFYCGASTGRYGQYRLEDLPFLTARYYFQLAWFRGYSRLREDIGKFVADSGAILADLLGSSSGEVAVPDVVPPVLSALWGLDLDFDDIRGRLISGGD